MFSKLSFYFSFCLWKNLLCGFFKKFVSSLLSIFSEWLLGLGVLRKSTLRLK